MLTEGYYTNYGAAAGGGGAAGGWSEADAVVLLQGTFLAAPTESRKKG